MLGIPAYWHFSFLLGYPWKVGSLKQGFLRKFSWPSSNPDLPQSSTVVYIEVHPNHVECIESFEVEAASDWRDWELESTITKYGRQPRAVLEFSSNSYLFKTSPFTNKPLRNYKIMNFQSTPVLPFPAKPIQWNIHTTHYTSATTHGLQVHPNPLHPRSAFLSPQKSREEKVTSLIPTLPVRPEPMGLDPMGGLLDVGWMPLKIGNVFK